MIKSDPMKIVTYGKRQILCEKNILKATIIIRVRVDFSDSNQPHYSSGLDVSHYSK